MLKKYGLLIGVLATLSGCSSTASPPAATALTTPPATAMTPIIHQVKQMEAAGMQVVQQGDRLIVIIPTDTFFEPMTTNIKEERKDVMRAMALCVRKFSDLYPNSIIRVTGYTDQAFSQRSQLEWSQRYADAVSAYIFNTGIEVRRIATQGRGSNEPIANQRAASSAAFNRRVVVQVN